MKRKVTWRRLAAWLFPHRCVCCGRVVKEGTAYCDRCAADIERIEQPICPQCGRSRQDCFCKRRRSPCDRTVAPFYYTGAMQRAVLRLKRHADPETVSFLVTQMYGAVRQQLAGVRLGAVTYVPMTERSIGKRGYNQSRLLAEELARRLELPLIEALSKRYETPPQKALDLRARSGNVLGVFDVIEPRVKGQTLLLVDDLVTTGATVNECAKMLKIYGARQVMAVALTIKK